MTSDREPTLVLPKPSRSPWQALYRAGHRQRLRYYKDRARSVPVPVISVGNLHWGGTGKTPTVIAIASHLRDAGQRVCVLSRGYGRQSRGTRIVSLGDGPLISPDVAGDEPTVLANALPGVSLVVAEDRAAGAEQALQRISPNPQLFLLDDGFSHLRIRRTLDLLVLPRNDPFGGGQLPPGGRLREPLEAAARAHGVLLAGGQAGEGQEVAEALRRVGFSGPGFSIRMTTTPPQLLDGSPLAQDSRALLVTGIARPHRVLESAKQHSIDVCHHLAFRDHQRYGSKQVKAVLKEFKSTGAQYVLTTSKDAVKLRSLVELPIAQLPLKAEIESSFFPWLDRQLETK